VPLLNPKPGERLGGRKKGTRNKVTTEMRAVIEFAVKGMGGQKALLAWGKENPTLFWTKIFPLIVPKAVELSGMDGQALELRIIERVVTSRSAVELPPIQERVIPANGNGHH